MRRRAGAGQRQEGQGRKQHIVVDTTGLVLAVVITATAVKDRDGAVSLLWNLYLACTKGLLIRGRRQIHRRQTHPWAATLKMTMHGPRRDRHVFEVLPPRRVGAEADIRWISKSPPHRLRLRTPACPSATKP
jgi:hypothetical protein